MSVQKLNYQNHIIEMTRKVEILRKERDTFEYENSTNFCEVKRLNELSNVKDKEILDLKCCVEKLQQDLKSICGDFLFECRDLKKVFFLIHLVFNFNQKLLLE